MLGAAATVTGPVLAQDTDDAPEPELIAAQEFSLGERFSGPGWELEVQDAFSVRSPDRADYTEVRVGVAMTTTSTALPYLFNGLTGGNGYPELTLRDSSGEHRTIPVTDPGAHLLPGSVLSLMLPGVPARWTVGFEVPTAFASTLLLDASWDGQVVATWDLRGPLLALTLSHLYSFVVNYLMGGEFLRMSLQKIMFQPYGRIVALHVAILLGGLGAQLLGSPVWALLILIAVKIGFDVTAHLRAHRYEQAPHA